VNKKSHIFLVSSQTCFHHFSSGSIRKNLDQSGKILLVFQKKMRYFEREKNAQILDSHPGMAFAKWLACLDEESFSFEVLFA
jgi:hypothetical protein